MNQKNQESSFEIIKTESDGSKTENNQPIENDLSFKNQSLNVLLKIDRSNRKICS